MKKNVLGWSWSVGAAATAALFVANPAFAQDPPQAEPPAAPGSAAPPPPAAPPAAAPAAPAPAAAAPAPAPEKKEAPPAEEKKSPFTIGMFVDAYLGYNTERVNQGALNGVDGDGNPLLTSRPWHREYAQRTGANLSWLGVDMAYDAGAVGATASLRWGPAVPIFFAAQEPTDTGGTSLGLQNVLQAYGTWKPLDKLAIDIGQFGTPFGAEVAESWKNLNYTRGGLYYGMQPFWHTGVRAGYQVTETTKLTAMYVNGTNKAIETDGAPAVGLQLSQGLGPVTASLGWLNTFAPEKNGETFDTLIDVVVAGTFGDFTVIFNGDYTIDRRSANNNGESATFYGLSLAGGYAISKMFGVALRGEYLVDNKNTLYNSSEKVAADGSRSAVSVLTGTLTLDLKPIPDNSNLIIRWDNRIESSNASIYSKRTSTTDGTTVTPDFGKAYGATVLGVVVKTN